MSRLWGRQRQRLLGSRKGRREPQRRPRQAPLAGWLSRVQADVGDLGRTARLRGAGLLLLAGAVAAALLLASLRVEILRTRYQLAQLAEHEDRLLEERSRLRVSARQLRDPDRLAELAVELGFGPPERVIHLEPPTVASLGRP